MKLKPGKQEKIIKAALIEFTEHNYKEASTNRIVNRAGIGKGMLFYYFNSKKDLYYFLVDYGIEFIKTHYLDKIDETMGDFIEKYKDISQLKLHAYTRNPEIFNFFGTLYLNKDMMLSKELEEKLFEVRTLGFKKLFNNIDKSLFREDIDPDEGIRLIRLSMDGYENELLAGLQGEKLSSVDLDPYWEDFYRYLDLLKKILYK